MKFRRRFSYVAEVPSSSMSDIAFLLLIFFMVTTAFAARKGLDLRLPGASAQAQEILVKSVHIEVLESGDILINDIPSHVEDIQSVIGPIIKQDPSIPVILQVDDNALYDHMIDVFDELRQADVENISLPTREDIASW